MPQKYVEVDEFGIRREYSWDAIERRVVVKQTQDCQGIVDLNNERQNGDGMAFGRTAKMEAAIPVVVFNQWCYSKGINLLSLPIDEFQKIVRRFLADPDWKKLRASKPSDGRVYVKPQLFAARKAVRSKAPLVAADPWTQVGPRPV